MVAPLAVSLMTLFASSPHAIRDEHRVTDVRWIETTTQRILLFEKTPAHLVVSQNRAWRVRCKGNAAPYRYVVGPQLRMEGEFSLPQKFPNSSGVHENDWFFTPLHLRAGMAQAFTGENCKLWSRRAILSKHGLYRMEFEEELPARYALEHQFFNKGEQHWLKRDSRAYWLLRPLGVRKTVVEPRTPSISEGAKDARTQAADPHGSYTWDIQGPARVDILAAGWTAQKAPCLHLSQRNHPSQTSTESEAPRGEADERGHSVAAAGSRTTADDDMIRSKSAKGSDLPVAEAQRSCQKGRPAFDLPWIPDKGLYTRRHHDAPITSTIRWRVAVGPGLHQVHLDNVAEATLLLESEPHFQDLRQNWVEPGPCALNDCPGYTASEWKSQSPQSLSAERLLYRQEKPIAVSTGVMWLPLARARSLAPVYWLDSNSTMTISLSSVKKHSDLCSVQFSTGQTFVAPGEKSVGHFRLRNGNDPSALASAGISSDDSTRSVQLPNLQGCRGWVRIFPNDEMPGNHRALTAKRYFVVKPRRRSLVYISNRPRSTTVFLTLPGTTRSATLWIDTPAGKRRFTLHAMEKRVASTAGPMLQPIALDLGAVGTIRVSSDAPVAVRVLRKSTENMHTAESLETADLTSPSMSAMSSVRPSVDLLRNTAQRLAHATTDISRAAILCKRTSAFMEMGKSAQARQEFYLAEALHPNSCTLPVSAEHQTSATFTSHAKSLGSAANWLPLDPYWVTLKGPTEFNDSADFISYTENTIGALRRGDMVGVATNYAREKNQPQPNSTQAIMQLKRWRRGIAHGQVMSREQKLLAYIDYARFHAGSYAATKSSYELLRTGSRWQALKSIAGTRRVRNPQGREASTKQKKEHSAVWAQALPEWAQTFPEMWPKDETLDLGSSSGWVFEPTNTATLLGARCRVRNAMALHIPCMLILRNAQHEILRRIQLPAFGEARTVQIPANTRTQVMITPGTGFTRQIRLPPELLLSIKEATPVPALRFDKHVEAHFTVVLPTVVRVHVLEPHPKEPIALYVSATRANSKTSAKTRHVAVKGDLELPLTGTGTMTLSITSDNTINAHVFIRVPRLDARESVGDRLMPEIVRDPPQYGVLPAKPPRPQFYGREQTQPGTLTARSWVGSTSVTEQPDLPQDLRAGYAIGGTVASRSRRLFLDGSFEARHDFRGQGLGIARLGLDIIHQRAPVDIRTVVDGWLASNGKLWSGLTRAYAQVQAPRNRTFRPFARLEGSLHFTNSGDIGGRRVDPIVDSAYRRQHPWYVGVRSGATLHTTPMERLRMSARVVSTSSAFGSDLIEFASLEAIYDKAWPGVQLRIAPTLEHRFKDRYRTSAYWNPKFHARLASTFWPMGDLGIRVSLRATYRPYFGSVVGGLVLTAYYADDRALADVRPSKLIHANAASWYQDARAEQDWPD